MIGAVIVVILLLFSISIVLEIHSLYHHQELISNRQTCGSCSYCANEARRALRARSMSKAAISLRDLPQQANSGGGVIFAVSVIFPLILSIEHCAPHCKAIWRAKFGENTEVILTWLPLRLILLPARPRQRFFPFRWSQPDSQRHAALLIERWANGNPLRCHGEINILLSILNYKSFATQTTTNKYSVVTENVQTSNYKVFFINIT